MHVGQNRVDRWLLSGDPFPSFGVRGDTLELDDYDGNRCLRTVRRIGAANGYLYLAAPEEGGSLERRHGDADDPFRWELASAENLRERRALALDLSPSGEMRWRRTNIAHG